MRPTERERREINKQKEGERVGDEENVFFCLSASSTSSS